MKVDFSKPILTINDEPMARSNVDSSPVDLGWVAVTALLADTDESYDAKVRAFALAKKVNGGGEVDITPEDSIVIRDRVAKVFKSVTVVARAVEMLNG